MKRHNLFQKLFLFDFRSVARSIDHVTCPPPTYRIITRPYLITIRVFVCFIDEQGYFPFLSWAIGLQNLFAMIPRPWNFHDPVYLPRRRSRRNRSSTRSRRPKPEYDRNIISAFFALATAVLLAIAEAEPKWIKIIGGKCTGKYLGLYKVIAYSSSSDLGKFV